MEGLPFSSPLFFLFRALSSFPLSFSLLSSLFSLLSSLSSSFLHYSVFETVLFFSLPIPFFFCVLLFSFFFFLPLVSSFFSFSSLFGSSSAARRSSPSSSSLLRSSRLLSLSPTGSLFLLFLIRRSLLPLRGILHQQSKRSSSISRFVPPSVRLPSPSPPLSLPVDHDPIRGTLSASIPAAVLNAGPDDSYSKKQT